jgi:hypothetical protein
MSVNLKLLNIMTLYNIENVSVEHEPGSNEVWPKFIRLSVNI